MAQIRPREKKKNKKEEGLQKASSGDWDGLRLTLTTTGFGCGGAAEELSAMFSDFSDLFNFRVKRRRNWTKLWTAPNRTEFENGVEEIALFQRPVPNTRITIRFW